MTIQSSTPDITASPTDMKSNSRAESKLNEAYNLAGEAATEMMEKAKTQAKATFDTNKVKVTEASEKAESLIKEHPLIGIGCAFVAGWAVSKLMK